MNDLAQSVEAAARRTSVDLVFDYLKQEIVSLRLLPGTKISEAEIAKRFGVSRQPVRDAFNRLENIDLLLIRPQRATEVRRFSTQAIERARFVRAAVEAEVLRRAARHWNDEDKARLQKSLKQQEAAKKAGDATTFHQLDYDFHKELCLAAKVEFAIDVIAENKSKVDRLCVLSLVDSAEMHEILKDHKDIAACVLARDEDGAAAVGMRHLSRLDDTIEAIRQSHAEYFED